MYYYRYCFSICIIFKVSVLHFFLKQNIQVELLGVYGVTENKIILKRLNQSLNIPGQFCQTRDIAVDK